MLLTLEIDQRSKDAKTLFKYLRELSYVKIVDKKKEVVSKEKERILNGLDEAVKELNLVLAGKKEARDVEELLREL